MFVTNNDGIHDMALSNQIRSQLLWKDFHPAPDIVFTVLNFIFRHFKIKFISFSQLESPLILKTKVEIKRLTVFGGSGDIANF